MPTDIPFENWALFLLLAAVTTFMMLIMIRRRGRPAATGRDAARQRISRLNEEREVRDSMGKLLIRLEEYSRDINGQLDTKFVRLEQVVHDADDRINRLQTAIDQHDQRLGRLVETRRRLRQDDAQGMDPSSSPAAAERPAVSDSPALTAETAVAEPRYQHVYELADAGSSPTEIAERLDMPLGEIELILNLRNAS